MSVEQVKAFFAKVNDDSSLAQKLKDAQAAYTGDKSDKDAAIAAIFVPVAAQAGFNFTVEDFKAVFDNNEEGESSAEELKVVAGGDGSFSNLCRDPASNAVFNLCKDPANNAVSFRCRFYSI